MVEELKTYESFPEVNSELSQDELKSVGERVHELAEDDRLLTPEEIRTFVEEYNNRRIAEAPKEAKFQATQIRSLEDSFAKQLERSKGRGEKHIPKKEFEIWERDLREYWVRLQGEVHLGKLDMPAEAVAEEPMMRIYDDQSVLSQTVEAQAGHFYDERQRELLAAIRSSGNEHAIEDEKIVRGFRRSVIDHIAWRTMSKDEVENYGAREADAARTAAHNGLINHFNALNSLAEQYGTTRFTPRDFWTSNVPKERQTPEMAQRMRNDRDIVEEYYQIAFAPEYRDAVQELERDRKFW